MKWLLTLAFTLITTSSFASIDCRKESFKSDRRYCEESELFGCEASNCGRAAICVGQNIAQLEGRFNAKVSMVEMRNYGSKENFFKIEIRSGNSVTYKIVTTTQTTFPKNICHPHAVK